VRNQMEKQLAEELKANGINAVTAYGLYGPAYFQDLTEKEVLKKIKGTNIDAVITINLIDKNKERLIHKSPELNLTKNLKSSNPGISRFTHKPEIKQYETQRSEMIGIASKPRGIKLRHAARSTDPPSELCMTPG